MLLAALVCEKVERPADALLYLEKALRVGENDPTTDMRPTTHAIGHALRGRMLAAQGKQVEAEAAFEQMQAAGVTPNVYTYSFLISAYDKGGQWQKAQEAVERMQAAGEATNDYT